MARRSRSRKKDFFDTYDVSSFSPITPSCSHFVDCGGCSFQNISYSDQIQMKKDFLQDLFNEDVDVISATNSFGYRNRMDFVYNKGVLGLRKKGDFKTVVDIKECYLIPNQFKELFSQVKEELSSRNIPSYDIEDQNGFLRYVVFRFAPNTGEVMLIFTTSSPCNDQERESFQDLLDFFSDKVTSLHWFINDALTDVSIPFAAPIQTIGKFTITEKIGDVSLSFGPLSFFQANTKMSELIFRDIKKYVSGETVDLCCGVGAISLFVASSAKSVCGVEEVSQAIDLAKKNASLSDIDNALFFADDMKNVLDYSPLHVDTLILDPPRAGLGPKTVKRILTLDPEKIIYMSCNPKTQKIDLDLLTKGSDYKITLIKGYDMFPQTPHVETLCVLEKNIHHD